MEAERETAHRLRFTTEELHLFQEVVLHSLPALEPTASCSEAQWNILCFASFVFANAVEEENARQGRVSRSVTTGSSAQKDFGGVFTAEPGYTGTAWKLYARPQSINIDRKMLVSTLTGGILENRGLMGCALLLLVALNVGLDYFVPVSDVRYVRMLSDENRLFELKRCGTSMLVLHMASRIVLGFLLAHRINRQILMTSIFYFETVTSTGALVLAHVVWMMNCFFLTQDAYNLRALIEDCMLLVCSLPILVFVAASDSLRFGLFPKIISVAIICAQLGISWLRTRCISDDWGESINCKTMESDGLSPRQLFLIALTLCLVFFMKGIVQQVSGNEFAVLRPCFRFSRGSSPLGSNYSRHRNVKIDCVISAETNELEIFGKLMEIGSVEALQTESSHVEVITQSSETRQVLYKLRPFLVQILNSAWNEHIPFEAPFTYADVCRIASGLPSTRTLSGASYLKWHLRSDPAKLELSRATLLSSRIGMKLHKRRLMGLLTAVLGILVVMEVTLMPSIEVRQGDMTYPIYPWYAMAVIFITFFMLIVVLQHNMNRALFALTFRCFETWVLTIASLVKCITNVYQVGKFFSLHDVGFDLIAFDGIIIPLLSVHWNCIDCWRFHRRTRISLYFLVVVYYLYEYYVMRCERNYWEESTNCSFVWPKMDGIRLREIYLGLLLSCLLFFAKALHRHLTGQVFAILHPQYCLREKQPDSTSHALDDSLSPSIGKHCSQDGQKEKENCPDIVTSLDKSLRHASAHYEQESTQDGSIGSLECLSQGIIVEKACRSLLKHEQAPVLPAKFSL